MRQLDVIVTDQLAKDVGNNATVHVAAVGCLDLAVCQLVKPGVALAKDTLLADVVARVADYTGYANGAIVWSGPTVNTEDGKIEYKGTVSQFRPTDGVTPNTIAGIAVIDVGGTKLYMVANISGTPIPMRDQFSAMDVTLLWRPQDNSLSVIIV
jgi:hypothetical protein